MPRITPAQQEVMDVVGKWVVDTKIAFRHYDVTIGEDVITEIDAKSPKYWVLIDAIVALLRKKREADAKIFDKAVETAYRKGYENGSGVGVKG